MLILPNYYRKAANVFGHQFYYLIHYRKNILFILTCIQYGLIIKDKPWVIANSLNIHLKEE